MVDEIYCLLIVNGLELDDNYYI